MEAKDGYDRHKKPRMLKFEYMSIDRARQLQYGWHPHIYLPFSNEIRVAKVNGRVRTWKRDLTRVEIPMKYGFNDCFTVRNSNGVMMSDNGRAILVIVTEE